MKNCLQKLSLTEKVLLTANNVTTDMCSLLEEVHTCLDATFTQDKDFYAQQVQVMKTKLGNIQSELCSKG